MIKSYQGNEIQSIKVKLTKNKNKVAQTSKNVELVFLNDPNLRNLFSREFKTGQIYLERMPFWRVKNTSEIFDESTEMSEIYFYLDKVYGLNRKNVIDNTLNVIANRNEFHPIERYLDSINWDNSKRLETLFIDYLGADDNSFNRTMTKKVFTAGVARIYQPGYKYDEITVLAGRQGIGKSYLLNKLGKDWFNDSVDSFKGDDFYIKIDGSWIVEISELTAILESKTYRTKQVLSQSQDNYRKKYGKRAGVVKRECIFFGTTNEDGFLKDKTGNRRFITIRVGENKITKNVFEITDYEIDQIWAEAKDLYLKKYPTHLTSNELIELQEIQKDFYAEDEIENDIVRYLVMKFPEKWYQLKIEEQQDYFENYNEETVNTGYKYKNKVCAKEIRNVVFKDTKIKSMYLSNEINKRLRKITGINKFERIRFKDSMDQQRGIFLSDDLIESIKNLYLQ